MYKQKKRSQKGSHLPLLSMLLMINLCGILILTAFNYYIFQYKNKKNYQEGFISYNQQITELAFKNIDQKIMQSVLELPQQYFSSIDENKPLLLPQAQPIADSPEHIRALSAEMLKLQKSYPFLAALDVYYEATDTVVTNFSHVHVSSKFPVKRAIPSMVRRISGTDTTPKRESPDHGKYVSDG